MKQLTPDEYYILMATDEIIAEEQEKLKNKK
jgi:hypothetical protein